MLSQPHPSCDYFSHPSSPRSASNTLTLTHAHATWSRGLFSQGNATSPTLTTTHHRGTCHLGFASLQMAVLRTEQAVGAQQPDSASRRYGNSERERREREGEGGVRGEKAERTVGGVRQGDGGGGAEGESYALLETAWWRACSGPFPGGAVTLLHVLHELAALEWRECSPPRATDLSVIQQK